MLTEERKITEVLFLHENAQRMEWILKPMHTERRKTNSTWSFPQSTGALGGTVMVEL